MHTVQRADDFSAKSKALTSAYWGKDWNVNAHVAMLRIICKVRLEILQQMARSDGPRKPAAHVTLNSLGIIDKYLKKDYGESVLAVEQFRLGSAIMARQPTLYIWTLQGELALSVDYNEA